MAMHRETPAKTIGSITPAMNFGYVSIEGEATRPMRYYRDGDRVSSCCLYLKDDTGSMRVTAFRQVAEKLAKRGVSIRKGDTIKVAGKIRVVEGDNISMTLEIPDHLEVLETTAPEQIALEELKGIDDGKSVELKASISRIELPRSARAPFRVFLADGTGTGELKIWPNQFERIANQEKLLEGAIIGLRALKSEYRGKPQLELENGRDLVILAAASTMDAPPAPERAAAVELRNITLEDVGKQVTVKATVSDVRFPREGTRAPYTVTLVDGGAKLPLVFWSDTHADMKNAAQLKPGAVVRVGASVGQYRGRVQLRLDNASDLVILESSRADGEKQPSAAGARKGSAARPGSGLPVLSPDEALAKPDRTRVTVRGIVERVRLASAGTKAPNTIYLKTEGESVPLVYWTSTCEIPSDQLPGPGAEIKATVMVASYRGVKQLKLSSAGDYALERRGSSPGQASAGAPVRSKSSGSVNLPRLSSLQRADVGAWVRIKGRVKSVIESTKQTAPYRIILEEGSATATVVVWPDVWANVLPGKRPTPGVTVRALGKVTEFHDKKQVRVIRSANLEVVR